MRTYEEHLDAVRGALNAPHVVTRHIHDADGLVLAQTIAARYPVPRFDDAQVAGYAVTSLEGGTFTVGETIKAGVNPRPLEPGLACPIMPGAKVPAGTLAIIREEDCQPAEFAPIGTKIQVPAATEGQNIRREGEDVGVGRIIIAEGTRLAPAAISALASQEITEVEVYRPTRVIVATGGAEIGGTGEAQIPDANAPMFAALANEYDIEIVAFIRTNDDPGILISDLEGAIRVYQPDAIITAGGTSPGQNAVVRQAFEDNGWFGSVAQQPGGPQGIAHLHGVPVIALPGNPVSALVSFRLYVGQTMGRLRPPYTSRITEDVQGLEGRDQFRRGILFHTEDGEAQAELLMGKGSHLISEAMSATALIRIPAGAQLKAGDPVQVFPF